MRNIEERPRTGCRSANGDDLDGVLSSLRRRRHDYRKVALVARVEPRGMGARRSRDQKIHHARFMLTPCSRDRDRWLPGAGGYRIFDRKRREPTLTSDKLTINRGNASASLTS